MYSEIPILSSFIPRLYSNIHQSLLFLRYKGYLLKKYNGEKIEWSVNGKSFKLIKEDGSKITFTTQPQLYKKVGNRLVSGVNLNSEEGSEFLYNT